MHYPFKVQPNDPTRAGAPAGSSWLSPGYRYRIQPMHTRFLAIEWLVFDADTLDETDLSAIIRQKPTFEAAIAAITCKVCNGAGTVVASIPGYGNATVECPHCRGTAYNHQRVQGR